MVFLCRETKRRRVPAQTPTVHLFGVAGLILTHCQALTGLLIALGKRRKIPGTHFSQNLQTIKTVTVI